MLINILSIIVKGYYYFSNYFLSPKKIKYITFKPNQTIEERIKETRTQCKSLYYVCDGNQPIIMINDLATAKAFIQAPQYKNIIRTYPYLGYVYEKTLKNCIGTHTGQDWLLMKKPLSKFFTTRSVINNYDMIIQKTHKWIESSFSDTSPKSLQNLELDKLTIDIMSNIIYGQLSDEQLDELYQLSLLHNKMMMVMGTDMTMRVSWIYNNFDTANKRLTDEFWQRWTTFHQTIELKEDTLYHVMISDERYIKNQSEFYQTLYEIMLFNLDIMIDGFSNLIWNIASHPEIENKIYEECKDVDMTDHANYTQMDSLKFLQNVIFESARMNPGIVNTFAETITEDMILSGCMLKAGSKLSLDTQMINRDPAVWIDPHKFDPSRFDDSHMVFSFHRFGLSPRKCMGNVFADYILKIGIVSLIQKFDFDICDDSLIKENRYTIPNLSNYNMMSNIKFIQK